MEVFLEMGAAKLWGEAGRWFVIGVIQIAKYLLFLLFINLLKEICLEENRAFDRGT